MLKNEVALTVPGTPAPKGSMKCIGARGKVKHQLIEDNEKTVPWRVHVAKCARLKLHRHTADPRQAVGVEVTITLNRPSSHMGQGRNKHRVKPSAPAYPTSHSHGDADKFLRLILDALQDATVLVDDAQVIETSCRKAYVDLAETPGSDVLPYPGAVIRLYPIGDP